MTPPPFPFSALVDLEPLKRALELAAVDGRLSVLLRGDKGAGKTTAARALGPLLGAGAPFVDLPLGVTEDRLLGGLDVERAMKGETALKPGLVAGANGGVLYIDEVNLLADHLADALLDAVASGVHVVEREGFSAVQEARFVLVGSMNPEEGALRPQLTDRFALAVDAEAPSDPGKRRLAIERRLRFDEDPAGFALEWREAESALALRLEEARGRRDGVSCSPEILERIGTLVCGRGVRSLRADLAVVRASRALAAIEGAALVSAEHVDFVLPLVLAHRAPSARGRPPKPETSSPSSTPSSSQGADGGDGAEPPPERILAPQPVAAPRLMVAEARGSLGRTPGGGSGKGPVVRSRRNENPQELDVRGSIAESLSRTGSPRLRPEDLRETVRALRTGRRFLFVVDSSGSHAVRDRMRLVKGAVAALLDESAGRQDEAAVVAFRGASATLVLAPTREWKQAQAALSYLPTGGRTPLAHGLELAAQYVNERTVLVLLTDGRANVKSRGEDPWADALRAAAAIRCPALVVDSESGPGATGRARELARAMRASHLTIDGLDEVAVLRLARGEEPEPA